MSVSNFTVGRSGCDIILNKSSISSHHLTLTLLSESLVRIVDNNSTNGTFIQEASSFKKSIQAAEVSLDCQIYIADYQTSVRALLAQLPINPLVAQQTNNQNQAYSKQPRQDSSQPFSRYIRSDDGEFEEK